MDTNREDKPREINPEEVNRNYPGKEIKAKDKINIKESEFGREQGQNPADEHVEKFTQIDRETKKMQNENQQGNKMYDLNSNEIDQKDNRDQDNGTEDWGAENNRSGRHK